MLNGHGDDIYNCKREIVSNFSSNIYNSQDLSALQSHLRSHLGLIHSYPEPEANSLNLLLAEKHNIDFANICVTNGATEAIYLIAQAFGKSKTTVIIPTFSEYEDACRINGHELAYHNELESIDADTKMVWICNPNNPTGFIYDIEYLKTIVEKHPDAVFVFDQSYGHFTDKTVWNIPEAVTYKNVILLHSMTKQYAIPGLRLGYITACNELVEKISTFRMPWSVNALAIEAGKFLLKNEPETVDIKAYLKETTRLQDKLRQIEGLTVYPTEMHFFLCRLKNRSANELKSYLINKHGILIRDASNFRGLDESFFRIATQSEKENDLLVKAIKEWI